MNKIEETQELHTVKSISFPVATLTFPNQILEIIEESVTSPLKHHLKTIP